MKKRFPRHVLLIALILAWLLIPHYITGIPGYVALAVISGLSVMCFYTTRGWRNPQSVSDKKAKRLRNLCLALSVCVTHLYIPIILISSAKGYHANKVMSIVAIGVFILNWYTYTLFSGKATDNLMNASICFAGGTLGLCYIFLVLENWKGLRPLPWAIALIGCLAVCLISFISSQVPRNKIVYDAGWLGCILIAIVVTVLLNAQFCSERYTVKTYYAYRSSKIGMSCILPDGYEFNYSGCPTPLGGTGKIHQYDGWFHIRFLSE